MIITADLIYTGKGKAQANLAIEIDEGGTIINLHPADFFPSDLVVHYNGLITPGFVNSHCHLELSHLKGEIPTGTGLIPFISSIVRLRDFPQEVIDKAVNDGNIEMIENGIVGVGDISNKKDTIAIKETSTLQYHTFVECFDMLQDDNAQNVFTDYFEVYESFSKETGTKSLVPHAPYSVSKEMFMLLRKVNSSLRTTISIHNQETSGENEFFMSKTGAMLDFYNQLGIDLSEFQPTGTNSIEYAVPLIDSNHRLLLVHNTICTQEDIAFAQNDRDVFWCTCPNANLYIENKLPDYRVFMDSGAKMCIGTDSLASNWSLSILDEMKTILKYNSWLELETVLSWATYNGAQALGMDKELGSIEIGKKPGINLISAIGGNLILNEATKVKRII